MICEDPLVEKDRGRICLQSDLLFWCLKICTRLVWPSLPACLSIVDLFASGAFRQGDREKDKDLHSFRLVKSHPPPQKLGVFIIPIDTWWSKDVCFVDVLSIQRSRLEVGSPLFLFFLSYGPFNNPPPFPELNSGQKTELWLWRVLLQFSGDTFSELGESGWTEGRL